MENNKKTETIKESLANLLCQLKCEKKFNEVVEFAANGSSILFYSDIDLDVKCIKSLEKLKFKSIDDLNSVKKLREIELHILNNDNLKKFTFPNYELQIDPILLIRINIEIELENVSKKAEELISRGHKKAGEQMMGVVLVVETSIRRHFQKGKNDKFNYINLALVVIVLAIPIIEQHLGYKRILGNLFLLILTLRTAHIANKMVNNHFLFFRETESTKQLMQLEHAVSKLTV